jgi:hypothetical protein
VWNLSVSQELDTSNRELTTALADIKPGQFPAEMLLWFDRLVTRKRETFSGDLRFVGNWSIQRARGMLNVQMEARLPEPIHARFKAAGIPIANRA